VVGAAPGRRSRGGGGGERGGGKRKRGKRKHVIGKPSISPCPVPPSPLLSLLRDRGEKENNSILILLAGDDPGVGPKDKKKRKEGKRKGGKGPERFSIFKGVIMFCGPLSSLTMSTGRGKRSHSRSCSPPPVLPARSRFHHRGRGPGEKKKGKGGKGRIRIF